MGPSISVVVPVYNSGQTLSLLTQRVADALGAAGLDYELVLVNDGSTDDSWARISEAARADSRVRGIDLARNYGQHNALLAGIRAARGDTIATIDDDLQNPPEEIPKLLAKLDEGYDVVYGSATERQHDILRALGTRLTKWALKVAIGSEIAAQVSAFRTFRTNLRDVFSDFQGPYVSIDALLSWGTARFAAVPVRHDARAAGRSSYGFVRLATHALNVLTGFTTRPLRIATLIGIALTIMGVGVLVYVFVRYFAEGDKVPGFPFLASLISIFSGAQLLTLGIIGEYLARMHVRIMDRPAYALREEVGNER
ncbi:MAG: glycosyltransferase family 2 protein [Actinomycetota bacterium]|nr:glycosyltransferase family 2 protein [Actinomycetota bacterium]